MVSNMKLKGTKFQQKVWKYLKTIPKGKNINNGANVVRAPNIKPEKYVIFRPTIKKQK